MKIVSVTLAGGNREDLILDALSSVHGWVDAHILFDTGESAQKAIELVKRKCGTEVLFEKLTLDSAADARNKCLSVASEIADYAVILDTDERIRTRGDRPREIIWQNRNVDYWIAYNMERRYSKVRVIKLPPKGAFSGHTHEAFCSEGSSAFFPNLRFDEVPKDPGYYQSYAEIILERMEKQISQEPTQGRWQYFKGDCLFVLKRYDEAIEAFERCYHLTLWNEEAAWACFRIAAIHLTRKEWPEAVKVCTKGIAAHPGIAELNWVAGVAALNYGFPLEATYFANMAITQGMFEGFGKEVIRRGCLEPIGLYEGPYEILEKASLALGKTDEAETWHAKWLEAKKAREES